MSVVSPCCLLGKEYLSSSDRCWHYHPISYPALELGLCTDTDLQERAQDSRDRQRRIDCEWARWSCLFWLELTITLLLWSLPVQLLKKLIPPEHPLPEA